MKVKTLLKTFQYVDYNLVNQYGNLITDGFVNDKYEGDCLFEDMKVVAIRTNKNCDELFIEIE